MNIIEVIKLLVFYIPNWDKEHLSNVEFVLLLDFILRASEDYNEFHAFDMSSDGTDTLGEELSKYCRLNRNPYISFSAMRSAQMIDDRLLKLKMISIWEDNLVNIALNHFLDEMGIWDCEETLKRKIIANQTGFFLGIKLEPYLKERYLK